eukprot:TRINITY_DN44166_c0_g1_i1.p1 TRINITY_DN44166_c0_g1~~TRINITY_DN44166_c0_g1_i1.p1  ORF type:complete len:261 (+),score=22.10 TRINITY_DN44166_c0_g1_i1:80-862(+)
MEEHHAGYAEPPLAPEVQLPSPMEEDRRQPQSARVPRRPHTRGGGGGGPVRARVRALSCGVPHWLASGLSDETLARRGHDLAQQAAQTSVKTSRPLPPVPPAPGPALQPTQAHVWRRRRRRSPSRQRWAASLQLAAPQPKHAAVRIELVTRKQQGVKLARVLAPYPHTERDRVSSCAFARRALLLGVNGTGSYEFGGDDGTHSAQRGGCSGPVLRVPRSAGSARAGHLRRGFDSDASEHGDVTARGQRGRLWLRGRAFCS